MKRKPKRDQFNMPTPPWEAIRQIQEHMAGQGMPMTASAVVRMAIVDYARRLTNGRAGQGDPADEPNG